MTSTLASTNILGALAAMNSYGGIASGMASLAEMGPLRKKLPFKRIKDRMNACGNNILVNDNAALVNPEISKTALTQIEEVLQVELVQGTVAGYNTVGSVCAVTNKGLLCHPSTTKEEMKELSELFNGPRRHRHAELRRAGHWRLSYRQQQGSVGRLQVNPHRAGKGRGRPVHLNLFHSCFVRASVPAVLRNWSRALVFRL